MHRRQLGQAVADPARQPAPLSVAQSDLVLEGGQDLVANLGHILQDSLQDSPRGEFAGAAVGPAGCPQADPPAGTPPKIVQGLGVRVHQEVGGTGPDPEPFVVGDRRVDRVEPEQQIGHDRPVLEHGLEGRRPEGLPSDRPVHVRDPQEHEAFLPGRPCRLSLRRGPGRCLDVAHRLRPGDPFRLGLTVRSTSAIVAAKRRTISASSSSVLINGGASTTWSPVYPSGVECVESTSRPRSIAVRSTRAPTSSSSGRNDSPSRGSTSSTPSRNPRPRTSRTISRPCNADASWSRRPGPRSRTRSTSSRSTRRSRTARPTAQGSGAPSQVWPRSNSREPWARASWTCCRHSTAPSGAYPPPSPFPRVTMSG